MELLFKNKTYLDRVKLVKMEMANRDIDALVLSESVSVQYLAGFSYMVGRHFYERPYERPIYLVITQQDEPLLLTPGMEYEHASEIAIGCEVHLLKTLWTGPIEEAIKSMVDILKNINVKEDKLGVEDRWTRHCFREMLPEMTIEDAGDIVTNLRMIKSDEEIQLIKLACHYTDYGFETLMEYSHEGATELELMNKVAFKMSEKMIDEVSSLETYDNLAWVKVNSGMKTVNTHGSVTNRRLKKGDILTFIPKAFLGITGYHGHLVRTAFLGKPNDQQKNLYEEAMDAQNAALHMIKPGIKCCDVDRAARRKRGGGGGFGIGIESHEAPYIRESDKRELKPGMTFYIPSGIYIKNHGAYKFGDNIMVTEKGYEMLTKTPRDIESMII
jgi:Xaa-Pro aminopeptidase